MVTGLSSQKNHHRLPAADHYTNSRIRDLQERIALSDEAAFTQLYILFHKKLLHFTTSLLRSKELAEEAAEDVFVKLWANRQRLNEIENLTVYLYVAAKNQGLNMLSKKARELVTAPFDYLDLPVDKFSADPHELMITAEMMARMQQVIEQLPPRCKMIFKLVREDGLKYKEVAEILNISVNTIDAQMAIAVKRICEALHVERTRKPFHSTQETGKKS